MSSKQDGIHVPYRVIFITVIVSICINLFFLLMGILIGKDDLKWDKAAQDEIASEAASDAAPPITHVEQELAVFGEDSRDEPVDVSYKAPVETRTPDPTPVRLEPKPIPDVKPREVTIPTRKAGTASSQKGFWIQVVALKERGKAVAYMNRLKSAGHQAVVVDEGGFHKVQVGPYGDRGGADKDKARINAKFGVKAWVRTR